MRDRAVLALASPVCVAGLWYLGLLLLAYLRLLTFEASSVVLGLCLIANFAAGWWLAEEHEAFRDCLLWFFAGVLAVVVGWMWQRCAFLRLVPGGALQYGFFLTEEGADARFWILRLPVWLTDASLALAGCATCALAWRAGARWSIWALIAWWAVADLVFSFPSVYLSWDGEATLFI
jgi:hypothetical protein